MNLLFLIHWLQDYYLGLVKKWFIMGTGEEQRDWNSKASLVKGLGISKICCIWPVSFYFEKEN